MSKAKKVKKTTKAQTAAENSFSTWRYKLIISSMLVASAFLSYRALDIQVLDNDFLQTQGDARHLRTISLPAHRGMLLDRNGEVLALSSPVVSVWADPDDVPLNHENLKDLAQLVNKPVSSLKHVIKQKQAQDKEFVYIKRHLNPSVEMQVKSLNIPGVSTLREFKRYYPTGEVSAHVVGFSNIDEEGIEGLELQADDQLKGRPGKDRVLQDRRGIIINSVDLLEVPQPGQDIQLSLDKRLQYIAYRELQKAVKVHKAKSATLVLLDAHSGEVLALANAPSFNPNNLAGLDKSLLRNFAIRDLIEPGSTMKPFIIAAGLETKQINPTVPVKTSPGYMRVGSATIRDVRNFGTLDLTRIIQKSSNVGISKVAMHIPREVLWEKLSDMGFGELTKSQFPGESVGYLPFFGEWKPITQATLSYGYGASVTPLQLAQAYSIFANDGKLTPLTLQKVDHIVRGKQVLSPEVSRQVLAMMETVVSREGTAWEARIPGYRVAGKTGTVKKAIKGGYSEDDYLALFAGIAPVSEPRLVAVVVVDEPTSKHYYGGKVAAPVFANVMSEALRLLNIAPDDIESDNVRMAMAVNEGMQ